MGVEVLKKDTIAHGVGSTRTEESMTASWRTATWENGVRGPLFTGFCPYYTPVTARIFSDLLVIKGNNLHPQIFGLLFQHSSYLITLFLKTFLYREKNKIKQGTTFSWYHHHSFFVLLCSLYVFLYDSKACWRSGPVLIVRSHYPYCWHCVEHGK